MTYEISRLVQVMPAARLNKEMTANVLFRHQLRNISFRDMDSMVLSVCWFKAIRLRGIWQIKSEETIVKNWICLNIGHWDPGKDRIFAYEKRGGLMRDAKIIVVDDNEAILRSLRTVLSHEFKTIVTVSSPVLLPALCGMEMWIWFYWIWTSALESKAEGKDFSGWIVSWSLRILRPLSW